MKTLHTGVDVLLAERRGLLNQITSLASRGESRALTPEEQAQWVALTSRVEEIDGRVQAIEDELAIMTTADAPVRSMGRLTRPASMGAASGPDDSALLRSWLRIGTPLEQAEDSAVLTRRGYNPGAAALEIRAQSKGTLSAGGYAVPQGFLAEVSRTLQQIAPVRTVARVISTNTGETLRIPTNSDISNLGEIVAENAANNEQDLVFSEVQLGAFKYSSKMVRVSNELLTDSGIDLARYLAQQLGERIGRAQEAHFLTGTGSGQPQGVITAASTTSAASATAIGVDDLLNLVRDVDAAWLNNSGSVAFMMHPSVWSAVRKLKDSTGAPLIGSLAGGADPKLLGFPVILTNTMDSSIASTKKTILFGAFANYAIRDVSGIVVARSGERYFEYDQTVFVAYQRTDAKVLQANAFRVLAH